VIVSQWKNSSIIIGFLRIVIRRTDHFGGMHIIRIFGGSYVTLGLTTRSAEHSAEGAPIVIRPIGHSADPTDPIPLYASDPMQVSSAAYRSMVTSTWSPMHCTYITYIHGAHDSLHVRATVTSQHLIVRIVYTSAYGHWYAHSNVHNIHTYTIHLAKQY
jgi:hypothetical protein